MRLGPGRYADRIRGLIAILWRAGLRISEGLALTESDLDPKAGSVGSGDGSRRTNSGTPTRSVRMSKLPLDDRQRDPFGITSIYLQGIDTREIVDTVHHRRPPVIPASAGLRP